MARNRIAVIAFAALVVVPLIAVLWLTTRPDDPPAPTGSARPQAPGDIPPAKAPEPPTDGLRLVKGQVNNQNGEPVMGATARIKGQKAEAISDREGTFYLRAVPLEVVTVTVDATGFAQNQAEVPAGKAGDTTPVTITLTEAESVQGLVRNPQGNAQPKATVACIDRDLEEDPGLSVVTDIYGEFILPPRAEGCEVKATHPLFGASKTLRVKKGRGNELDLRDPASIAGTVVDEQGNPLSGALVAVAKYLPAEGETRQTIRTRAKTAEDGSFLIEKLPPGRVVLVASIEGRPPAQSDEITIEDGEPVDGVRIESSLGAVLVGIVSDAGGEPMPGARVAMDWMGTVAPNTVRAATTDVDGRYELVGVPEGPFSIRVTKRGYTGRVLSGLTTDGRGEAQLDVALTAGDKTEFTGAGAVLIRRKGQIVLGAIVDDGPADAAGLQRFDRVISIDGESTEGWSIPRANQALCGEVGTRVTLVTERDGRERTVTLTRATYYR